MGHSNSSEWPTSFWPRSNFFTFTSFYCLIMQKEHLLFSNFGIDFIDHIQATHHSFSMWGVVGVGDRSAFWVTRLKWYFQNSNLWSSGALANLMKRVVSEDSCECECDIDIIQKKMRHRIQVFTCSAMCIMYADLETKPRHRKLSNFKQKQTNDAN